MFSTCQEIIRNRDDSPGDNGENPTNIFVFFSALYCVLFVANVGWMVPACMYYGIRSGWCGGGV